MTSGTATCVSFEGSDTTKFEPKIESLEIASADKVFTWKIGTRIFVVRFQH